MAWVIAVSNLKGGSAKSSTVITVGAELAQLGRRVLLCDLDPQGHVAEGYGIPSLQLEHDLSEVLGGSLPLEHVVQPLRPNLFLAPSSLRLARLEPSLVNAHGRENKLRRALMPMLPHFDVILVDTPPSIGIFTVNAFRAAQEVLIPMTTEIYALIGVTMLLEELQKFRQGLEHDIGVTGIVPTRFDQRTTDARDVVEQAKRQLGPTYQFFSPIPETVAVRKAATAGKPVTEYDPKSSASEAYRTLAKELLHAEKVQPRR